MYLSFCEVKECSLCLVPRILKNNPVCVWLKWFCESLKIVSWCPCALWTQSLFGFLHDGIAAWLSSEFVAVRDSVSLFLYIMMKYLLSPSIPGRNFNKIKKFWSHLLYFSLIPIYLFPIFFYIKLIVFYQKIKTLKTLFKLQHIFTLKAQ